MLRKKSAHFFDSRKFWGTNFVVLTFSYITFRKIFERQKKCADLFRSIQYGELFVCIDVALDKIEIIVKI